jgi:threonine dehydrogenase-like Zn-dependent dehydrogenase
MRAAVIAEACEARVADVARPEPRRDEVLVRLEGCGLCGSNLPLWEGRPWFSYPLPPGAPGHEGWGRVEALGGGVTGVAVGDRVALLSQRAFAEFDVAPAAAVVPLPAALDDRPLPGEPLGCAMNVFRRSDIQAGHTVVVIGIGFLGAILVQLAVSAGARVIAISRRSFARELARHYGADATIPLEHHAEIVDRVRSLTDGAWADRVIEAIGLQWPLDLAAELTRERGRLIIAGYHQDGPRSVNLQLWNWRGLDVVNAHERDERIYLDGIRAAVEAVAAGRIDTDALYTVYPLGELGQAMTAMAERPDGFLKALVTP